MMYRSATFILLTGAILSFGSRSDAEEKKPEEALPGVWQSSPDGVKEVINIRNTDKGWTVTATYSKSNKTVGSFTYKDVKFKDGKLTFNLQWAKGRKPVATWADSADITISMSGEKMKFDWGTGSRELERVRKSK